MRKVLWGVLFASFMGTATAAELDSWDAARYADSNDYSARLFYKLDFGGTLAQSQTVGLRFDNERAAARGAPAMFQARLDGQGSTVMLNGLDLRGPALAAGQSSGGGFFSTLTAAQWIGIGFTGLVFGTIVFEATDDEDTADGSGGY